MKSYWVFAKRDILAALRSPRYYILLSFYVFLQGYDFSLLFIENEALAIRQLMREIAFLLLFAAPLLTAPSIAGERDSGGFRLFMSERIDEKNSVVGKALAGLILLLPFSASTLIPVMASYYLTGENLAPMLLAVGGIFLLAITCGSVGLFASSFSKHSASAAASALGMLLLLAFLGVEASQSKVMNSLLTGGRDQAALTPFAIMDYLFRGILDTRALILFPTAAAFFLILSILVLRSHRWQFTGIEGPQGERGKLSRSTLVSLKLMLLSLVAVVIFGFIHSLNVNYHASWDISGYLSISPTLQRLLTELESDLFIYRVRPSISRSPLDDLLDEMAKINPKSISLCTWREKEHYQKFHRLGLLNPPKHGLILHSGDRVTSIEEDDLDVFSNSAERSIAKALNRIFKISAEGKIYFTEGSGEQSTQAFQRLLSTEGIQCIAVNLAGMEKLEAPSSSALAIIGPRVAFSRKDSDKVIDYLQRGGRLLLCIEGGRVESKQRLLKELSVHCSKSLALNSNHSLAGGGPESLLVRLKSKHPISQATGRIRVIMPGAVTLSLSPPMEDPLRKVLIEPPPGTISRNASEMGKPPLALALTLEGAKVKSPYRAAVFGDSDLFSDRILLSYPSNAELAIGLSKWLLESEAPESIEAKPYRVPLVLSRREAKHLMYSTSVLPALFVLALGFWAWYSYRKKLVRNF